MSAGHAAPATTRRLRDHWSWRPDWSVDRPNLWWYLTFTDQPAVARAATSLASGLRREPTMDVVPADFLHLTVCELGFADSMDEQAVRDSVSEVRDRVEALPAFQLQLDVVACMSGAVVLETTGGEMLYELRSRLQTGSHADAGQGSDARTEVPHVSLAYVNRDCDAGEVMDRMPEAIEPVPVHVRRVVLASVTRLDRHYQWEVRHAIDLGA